MSTINRRRFLYLSGAALTALITGCGTLTPDAPESRQAVSGESATNVPNSPAPELTPAITTAPPPAENTLPAPDIPAPAMKFTSLDDFYIQSYANTPRVEVDTWRLIIDGLVENPLTFTYEELRRLPAREVTWTLECISNPAGGNLIGNQVWKGTPLLPLLKEAGVRPQAIRVRWYAADGYSNSLPLERVMHPDTMLMYEMDGRPLTPEHGFPLRVLVPGHYGQKMPKWLQRIELIDQVYLGYWEQRGWDDMATIKPNSRIDHPRRAFRTRLGERLTIEGVAMTDESGVARVEVGVEVAQGNVLWIDTVRTYGSNPYTWVVWRTAWTPDRTGKFRVFARTWDNRGRTQRPGRASLLGGSFPAGSDYMHTVVVTVAEA